MSRRPNPAAIGAFVLGAAGLAVAAVLLLGSGRLLGDRVAFVLFFDEAVTGLSPGSAVNFQGVQVGRVTEVNAVLDSETGDVRIPVSIELDPDRVEVQGQASRALDVVRREIDRGLRARLRSDNLVTGMLYVDLDYYPERPAVFRGAASSTPEIPTIPTELEELRMTFAQVMERLGALPLEQLVRDLSSAMGAIDHLLNKPELASAIDQLDGLFGDARSTLARIDGSVDPLTESAKGTLDQVRGAIARLDRSLAGLDAGLEAWLAPESRVRGQLLTALEEVERAARSARVLADALKREPDALIYGRGRQ